MYGDADRLRRPRGQARRSEATGHSGQIHDHLVIVEAPRTRLAFPSSVYIRHTHPGALSASELIGSSCATNSDNSLEIDGRVSQRNADLRDMKSQASAWTSAS